MAPSVLGKRSRQVLDTEDVALPLPARKRQTRSSTPRIFEDSADKAVNRITHLIEQTKPQIRSKRTAARATEVEESRAKSLEYAVQDGFIGSTAPSLYEVLQDENIPPAIIATPSTNRFKDVFQCATPSTPKHRVRLAGTPLTPRTPRNGIQQVRQHSVFAAARQTLTQSGNPTKLVGRDAEREQLRSFISTSVESRSGGCTYVSGPPGTGKSAMVQEVLEEFESNKTTLVSIVNCVSLKTANEVYGKLVQDLAPDANISQNSTKGYLSKLLINKDKRSPKSFVIMLDEIDSLLDADCDILYTLFEWALHSSSRLALIGIANALDLTDRFLPRLKTRGLKPQILPFLPYTAQQISCIITNKLRSLLPADTSASADFVPFIHPAAIQLCGKKIASQTGDLRRAFSLVRRAIDQVERETLEKRAPMTSSVQPLSENANYTKQSPNSHSSLSKLDGLTVENAPRATIAHVARLASTIFNTGTLSRLSGLNLQQKAVLCSLVGGERKRQERNPFITPSKSSNKVPTVKELFIEYGSLCKRDEGLLHPLKDTEFRDVVASLETLGLVHEWKGRSSSLLTPTSTPSRAGRNNDEKQIVSAVSENEMRDSLTGAGADLLRRLLDDA